MSDHDTMTNPRTVCTCCLKYASVYQHQNTQWRVPKRVNRGPACALGTRLHSEREPASILLYTNRVGKSHVFRQQRDPWPNAAQLVKHFLAFYLELLRIPLLQYFLP